ncbi:hypothetical protein HPB47_015270 [Ixodes persulcatus]|uniref:Uncharacterized protein n=1 Tax=Ixodes persulcatus TaxID=34615 RepID=A0AC60QU18_IXOPE|nr:hypothetical protein HPB47_015270 [Ixodes persulcatus]
MSSWEPAEKHAFRLGERSFHIKCTQYLLSRLPFDIVILRGLRCLHPESRERESSSRDSRQLATKFPHVIQSQDVSALMDEYTLLQLKPIEVCSSSRSKDFGDIETGHTLLAEEKARLAGALEKVSKI